jgi:uncharacterized membrane protein
VTSGDSRSSPDVQPTPALEPVNEPRQGVSTEPRWPVALAIFAVLSLFSLMPDRVRLLPSWCDLALGISLILLMTAVRLGGNRERWLRIERVAMLALTAALLAMTLVGITSLIIAMVEQPTKFTGQQLLITGVEAWVTNVLAFSIVYWDVDRGGPDNRAIQPATLPAWLFPQTGAPNDVPPNWRPTYVDYLFLAFSTATAFSTTDVIPLTPGAKLLMMLESCISLATLAIVASRAINILGS